MTRVYRLNADDGADGWWYRWEGTRCGPFDTEAEGVAHVNNRRTLPKISPYLLATIEGDNGRYVITHTDGVVKVKWYTGDDDYTTPTLVCAYSGQNAYSECLAEVTASIRTTEATQVV